MSEDRKVFIDEVTMTALLRAQAVDGVFKPQDMDDRRYAKKLVAAGLFSEFMQRQTSGRNKTCYRLTDAGRAAYDYRKNVIRETFRTIAEKHAREMAEG